MNKKEAIEFIKNNGLQADFAKISPGDILGGKSVIEGKGINIYEKSFMIFCEKDFFLVAKDGKDKSFVNLDDAVKYVVGEYND